MENTGFDVVTVSFNEDDKCKLSSRAACFEIWLFVIEEQIKIVLYRTILHVEAM